MTGFVVYDLEYTSWEGSWEHDWSRPGEHREVVQIGAVRLSDQFEELDSLCRLVRPRCNPRLSDYFIALTGITQDQVDGQGLDLAAALADLVEFAAPGLPLLSNGRDDEVIAESCGLAGVAYPLRGRTGDVRPILEAAAGGIWVVSAELPQLFGFPGNGRGHDALADARNVAAALACLAAEGRFDRAAFCGGGSTGMARDFV